jgi:hypothetical protein
MTDEFITTEPIDMAYDGGLRETMLNLERAYGISVQVVNARGPGGGWPEVTLSGRRVDVARCLREQWTMGDPEADEEFVREVLSA